MDHLPSIPFQILIDEFSQFPGSTLVNEFAAEFLIVEGTDSALGEIEFQTVRFALNGLSVPGCGLCNVHAAASQAYFISLVAKGRYILRPYGEITSFPAHGFLLHGKRVPLFVHQLEGCPDGSQRLVDEDGGQGRAGHSQGVEEGHGRARTPVEPSLQQTGSSLVHHLRIL